MATAGPSRLSPSDGVAAVAAVVLLVTLGWHPVTARFVPAVWEWAIYIGCAAAMAPSLLNLPRRGLLPAVCLAAFWAAVAGTYPRWSAWQPGGAIVQGEVRTFALAAITTTVVIVLAAGCRVGVDALRLGWIILTASTFPVALWEIHTGGYLTVDPFFGPTGAPVAAFNNPNNYASVLLLGVGLAGLWATERVGAVARLALCGVALLGAYVILWTDSRMAMVCLLLLLLLTAWAAARRLGIKVWARQHPVEAGVVGSGLALATAGVFLVPALHRFNLVYRILFPGDSAIASSDEYRLFLLKVAGRLWLGSPIWGVGGGRFETLLRTTHPGNTKIPQVHNAFVEILVEYGVLPTAAMAALGLTLLWSAFVTPAGTSARAAGNVRAARDALVVTLLAFAYGATIIDSALAFRPWWLMLATAVGLAWRIGSRRIPDDRRSPNALA